MRELEQENDRRHEGEDSEYDLVPRAMQARGTATTRDRQQPTRDPAQQQHVRAITRSRLRGRLRRPETHMGAPALRPPTRSAHCPVCNRTLGRPLLSSPDRLHGVPGSFSVARCDSCGLGITLPVAQPGELSAFYPATYCAYGLPTGVLRPISAAIQRLQCWQALRTGPLAAVTELPTGNLLDVGCGRGDLGSWLVQRSWSVTGVEPSSQACAVARGRGVDARVGTLAEVELDPESYDVVVFRQSLEHVTDPVADLRRALGALRDGGVAIISVPNFGCWQRRRFGGAWFHLDLPRHRFHFDAEALRATLECAGFADVQTSTSSSTAGLPASIQYATLGRCLFPDGLAQRVAVAACALTGPVAWLTDRLTGGGDVLHAVARKPRA